MKDINWSFRKAIVGWLIASTITVTLFIFAARPLGMAFFGVYYASTVMRSMDHPQFAKKLADARRAGMPTKLSDLFQKLPPPNQNAALIYLKLTDAKTYPETPDEIASCNIIRTTDWSPTDYHTVKQFLTAHSDLISLSERAAELRECVVPRRDDGSDPADIQLPEYSQMRRTVRLISIRNMFLAQNGEAIAAVQNESVCFSVGRYAQNDLGLIGWLVGLATDSITLSAFQNILTISYGDPKVATAVLTAVSTRPKSQPLSVALEREIPFGAAETEFVHRHGTDAFKSVGSDPNTKPDSPWDGIPPMSPSAWDAFMDASGCYYLGLMRQAIADSALPCPQAYAKLDALDRSMMAHPEPRRIWAAVIFPDAKSPCKKQARIEARADITSAAARVFIWKAKHGAYPPTLAAAISPVPLDPFDGKPLRYRRESNGFVVYSIGETGKYDGNPANPDKDKAEEYRYPSE